MARLVIEQLGPLDEILYSVPLHPLFRHLRIRAEDGEAVPKEHCRRPRFPRWQDKVAAPAEIG